jgi:hypothetical protein
MPISRRRNIERASMAPATFAHAMSNTSTTPAPSAAPIVLYSETKRSRSGMILGDTVCVESLFRQMGS